MSFNSLRALAQSYSYDYDYTAPDTSSNMDWFSSPFTLVFSVIVLVSMWFIFKKAKKPGWAAIIPIYSTLVLLQIIKRPWWWILLLIIPIVNFIVIIMMLYELSKAFGKSGVFTLLLIFLPFIGFPMPAFGNASYNLAKASKK